MIGIIIASTIVGVGIVGALVCCAIFLSAIIAEPRTWWPLISPLTMGLLITGVGIFGLLRLLGIA